MSWFSGFGGASTAAGSAKPTTVTVPQYKDGVQVKKESFGQGVLDQMGRGGGGGGGSSSGGDPGSGSTLSAKRPIGEHPEADDLDNQPTRQGFARLAEMPARQRTYGTP